ILFPLRKTASQASCARAGGVARSNNHAQWMAQARTGLRAGLWNIRWPFPGPKSGSKEKRERRGVVAQIRIPPTMLERPNRLKFNRSITEVSTVAKARRLRGRIKAWFKRGSQLGGGGGRPPQGDAPP